MLTGRRPLPPILATGGERFPFVGKAFDFKYVRPLRCWFSIEDLNQDNYYHTFNSFQPDPPNSTLTVQSVRLFLGEGGQGTANIRFFDDSGAFNRMNGGIRGTVILKIGKTEAELTNALVATNPVLVTDRPDTNLMFYEIQATGKVVLLDERLVTFVRQAAYTLINDSTRFIKSDKMQAYKLVKELFTKESIMPLGAFQNTLEEHGNYDLSGISSKVNDFIATLDLEFSTARAVLDAIANIVGAIWFIDRFNKVVFEYPKERHSGILITDEADNPDNLSWASFPIAGWRFVDDASATAGFANDIIGKTDNPLDLADSSSATTNQNKLLFEQDLAQQIDITTQDFQELVLVLQRRGDEDDDEFHDDELHFHIVEDDSNQPTGKTIAKGDIKIDKIPEDPTPVFIHKMRFMKRPKVGTKAWVVLYRIHSDDNDHTVAWYHSDTADSTSATRDLSGEPDPIRLTKPSHTSNSGWVASVGTGPRFTYSVFDIATYLTTAYDHRSKERFGWVDKFVDVSFTSHVQTAMMIMMAYLNEAAKVKRSFDFPAVTIPNFPAIYWPDQLVTIHDTMSIPKTLNHQFKCTSVEYLFNAIPDGVGGSALGCRTCHITGVSNVDYLNDEAGDPSW